MNPKAEASRRQTLITVSWSISSVSVLMLIALGIILPSLFHALSGWLPRMIVLLSLCTSTAFAFLGAMVLSAIAQMLLVFEARRKAEIELVEPEGEDPDDGPFGGKWRGLAREAADDEDDIAPPAFPPKARRPRDAASALVFSALIVLLAGIGLVVGSAATLIVFAAPLL